MGVDTFVVLPGNVEVRNVASVLGKLFGNGHTWGSSGDTRWVEVFTVEVSVNSTTPSMAMIYGDNRLSERGGRFCAYYHFETSYGDHTGRQVTLGRAYAERIAVGKALVDFFGGVLVFNDCENHDDPANRYEVPAKTAEENSPQDGQPWYDLQRRMSDIQAVSAKEIAVFQSAAAYK